MVETLETRYSPTACSEERKLTATFPNRRCFISLPHSISLAARSPPPAGRCINGHFQCLGSCSWYINGSTASGDPTLFKVLLRRYFSMPNDIHLHRRCDTRSISFAPCLSTLNVLHLRLFLFVKPPTLQIPPAVIKRAR